jgi:hypothetical protein
MHSIFAFGANYLPRPIDMSRCVSGRNICFHVGDADWGDLEPDSNWVKWKQFSGFRFRLYCTTLRWHNFLFNLTNLNKKTTRSQLFSGEKLSHLWIIFGILIWLNHAYREAYFRVSIFAWSESLKNAESGWRSAEIVAGKMNYRGMVRSGKTFQSSQGGMVPVSKDVARRISREGGQVKRVRIAFHSPHQKRARRP